MDVQLLKQMYEMVLRIRLFEEAAIAQYRLGNIYGYLHPYIGEEAIAVGTISACNPDDYIVSTHRGHGHAIAKGHDLRRMMAELFGKATGFCGGRGGSMHVSNLEQYNLGANGIVGGGIPIATGAGLAISRAGKTQVVLCFFSDGAINNGVFHESVNLAAIYDLPVIYVLENNLYAVSTSVKETTRVENLSIRAEGYGIPGMTLDGNDAPKIYESMQEPLERARSGHGPTLMECKTYRHGGHHINDPGLYMPQEELAYWKSRDPLIILKQYLQESGVGQSDMDAIHKQVENEIEEAVQFALASPEPSPEEFLKEIASA